MVVKMRDFIEGIIGFTMLFAIVFMMTVIGA